MASLPPEVEFTHEAHETFWCWLSSDMESVSPVDLLGDETMQVGDTAHPALREKED